MLNPFQLGDTNTFDVLVDESRLAQFESGLVHRVYATFALAKDAEWVCRLFVLEMLEETEEGVGAYVSVKHYEPAPYKATVKLIATLESVINNKIHCKWKAFWHKTLIAEGEQTQFIINKEAFNAKIKQLFEAS